MKSLQIKKMLHEVNNEISRISNELQKYPSGHISCQRNGKYIKWYISDNYGRHYIPKRDINVINQMVKKEYLSSRLNDLLQEKSILEKSVKQYDNSVKDYERFINNSIYTEIMQLHKETSESEWVRQNYNTNVNNPEGLRFKSISGNILRSKSEVIIDQILFMNDIEYRYECKLDLGNFEVYPDFTIRHPVSGETYYWEHFGMMDNDNYAQKAFIKMQAYNSAGIVPGINLLMTFETQESPLNPKVVGDLVRDFFL